MTTRTSERLVDVALALAAVAILSFGCNVPAEPYGQAKASVVLPAGAKIITSAANDVRQAFDVEPGLTGSVVQLDRETVLTER